MTQKLKIFLIILHKQYIKRWKNNNTFISSYNISFFNHEVISCKHCCHLATIFLIYIFKANFCTYKSKFKFISWRFHTNKHFLSFPTCAPKYTWWWRLVGGLRCKKVDERFRNTYVQFFQKQIHSTSYSM